MEGWTAADQATVDTFVQQILAAAPHMRGGHPDLLWIGFLEATACLMERRRDDDPSALLAMDFAIDLLKKRVSGTWPDADEVRH